jgi:pre-mRNA-processing factor 6
MNIPEPGDYIKKRVKTERYMPVPDGVIESGRQDGGVLSTGNNVVAASTDPTDTPIGNLNDLGAARKNVMRLKLDKHSGSVTGTTTVDRKGYMTELESVPVNT